MVEFFKYFIENPRDALLVLALVAGWWFSRQIIKELRKLSSSVTKLNNVMVEVVTNQKWHKEQIEENKREIEEVRKLVQELS